LLAPLQLERRFARQPVHSSGWLACLRLRFNWNQGRTGLKFRHEGPLRIQKALYPDGTHCCHAVVVHPPGGIASGDRLQLDIDVEPSAHAVVTTPSATKWYGAFKGAVASQTIDIELQGRIEWLPAETIVFDAAQVASDIRVNAHAQASMIGWDLLIFGRHGSGERFLSGQFDQHLCVRFDDTPIWIDRLSVAGADALFDSPIGFDGQHAVSTFWTIAPEDAPFDDSFVEQLRQAVPEMAFTCLHPRLLVGRKLGDPIELDATLKRAWAWVRQHGWFAPAAHLRLWAT